MGIFDPVGLGAHLLGRMTNVRHDGIATRGDRRVGDFLARHGGSRILRVGAAPRFIAGRGGAQRIHLVGVAAQLRILRLHRLAPSHLVAIAPLPLGTGEQRHAEEQAKGESETQD